jgi:hypothetical protein
MVDSVVPLTSRANSRAARLSACVCGSSTEHLLAQNNGVGLIEELAAELAREQVPEMPYRHLKTRSGH